MHSFRRLRHEWKFCFPVKFEPNRRCLRPHPPGLRATGAAVFAMALALALAAAPAAPAQALDASGHPAQPAAPQSAPAAYSSSQDQPAQNEVAQDQTGQNQAAQDQAAQDQAAPGPAAQSQSNPAAGETPQQISVQARIRLRREQRRATAIHDTYDHSFESFAGMGFLRFTPGPSLQRTAYYGWDTGLTRFFSERFGVAMDARGYYGIAYVGLNPTNLTRPKISQYDVLLGPTYRFYIQPKYSIAGRVLGGFALGDFSGDTNGFGTQVLGLYPDGITFSAAGSLVGQYNLTPGVSIRLTGEDFVTGFGSTIQNSFGFTTGVAYRFGKQ